MKILIKVVIWFEDSSFVWLSFLPPPPPNWGLQPGDIWIDVLFFLETKTLIVWLSRFLKPPFMGGGWGQRSNFKRKNTSRPLRWIRIIFRSICCGFNVVFTPTPKNWALQPSDIWSDSFVFFGNKKTLIVWLSRIFKPPFMGVWGQYGDTKRGNKCVVWWEVFFKSGGL